MNTTAMREGDIGVPETKTPQFFILFSIELKVERKTERFAYDRDSTSGCLSKLTLIYIQVIKGSECRKGKRAKETIYVEETILEKTWKFVVFC
ncbi:jg23602 [Pararge aegeria aegeria]|uniref:Jg23602 protein n=1 Tax=Pararge aegeria aegeria TaxID=348720 RepID=A0A8S4SLN8_9NEOP|nr:jg23602 [Pararge aegeria aegeria]